MTSKQVFRVGLTVLAGIVLSTVSISLPAAQELKLRIIQTNSAGDNIHIIDPVTNKVVGEIKGIEASHGIAVSPDGTRIYISEEAVKLLASMSWPGNVRELENLIERLAIFAAMDEISAEEVERERASRSGAISVPENSTTSLPGKLQEMERQEILRVLRESGGNKSLAARKLGIERKTLYEKARRLAIDLQSKET